MQGFFACLLLSTVVASACGCILTTKEGAAADKHAETPTAAPNATAAASNPEISTPDWFTDMQQRLQSDATGLTAAWGLFSEGGWSDSGQVMVFAKKGATHKLAKPQLALVPPAKKRVASERALTASEWTSIKGAVDNAKGLKSIEETVFDGLIFQFVRLEKDKTGKIVIAQDITIKLAQTEQAPAYDQLIKAFQALRVKDEVKKAVDQERPKAPPQTP